LIFQNQIHRPSRMQKLLNEEGHSFGRTYPLIPSSANNTGEPRFPEHFPECLALGEVNLPRVLHSEKKSTRGREAFPSAAKPMALGEEWHSEKKIHIWRRLWTEPFAKKNEKCLPWVPWPSTRERWSLPRVPCAGTRGRSLFPECLFLALGEGSLPLVSRGSTRGNIFIFLVLLLHFFGDALPHYLKLFPQVWFNFEFFRYISLVFFVFSIFWGHFKFELHVHEII
jgi:hypothetical protein